MNETLGTSSTPDLSHRSAAGTISACMRKSTATHNLLNILTLFYLEIKSRRESKSRFAFEGLKSNSV